MLRFLVLAGAFTIALTNPLTQFNSNENIISRIAGGKNVTIESVPYQVSVHFHKLFACGGVIISDEWVLTAASCIFFRPDECLIRAGSSMAFDGGSVHKVDKIVKNPRWNGDLSDSNIALIHLMDVIHFDKTRQSISMFDIDEEPVSGAKAIISGWGKYPADPAVCLQSVVLDVMSRKECEAFYGGFTDMKNVICVYQPDANKGACVGDHGGPLTIEGRLAAIISTSWYCLSHVPDPSSVPSEHTNVAVYRAWIRSKTGI